MIVRLRFARHPADRQWQPVSSAKVSNAAKQLNEESALNINRSLPFLNTTAGRAAFVNLRAYEGESFSALICAPPASPAVSGRYRDSFNKSWED